MKLDARHDGRELVVTQEGGYSPDSCIVLRSIAQGSYVVDGIHWHYPWGVGTVLSLYEAAELLQAELDIDRDIAEAHAAAATETHKEIAVRKLLQKYMDNRELPLADFMTTPAPPPWWHQKIAYHWAMRVNAIYLAHKPGLGKTREGCDIIRGRINAGDARWPEQVWVDEHESDVIPGNWIPGHWAIEGGVLVVAPGIVLGTWAEELWRFQQIPATVVYSTQRQVKFKRSGVASYVHLITYDSLEAVEDNKYDGIIADELHFLANAETKRFARMQHLRQSAKWVVGLSGTPVSNMLPSLWSQYYWLDGGRTLGSSYESYRRRYFEGSSRKPEQKKGAAGAVAQKIARITYFLDMPTAFPDKELKVQQLYRVPMTQEQLHYYEAVRRDVIADVRTGSVTTENISVKLIKLLQICQGFVKDDEGNIHRFTSAKLHALRDMLTGNGDFTDRKTIVWCRFRQDLSEVYEMLTKRGIKCLALHGDVSRKERDHIRDLWNHDSSYRVMIGMIQIGIGVNLHAPNCVGPDGRPDRCSTTVFYGLDWRVTQLEQAMDRTYRGDQVETCLYRYLLSDDLEGTYGGDTDEGRILPIDMRVYNILQEKLEQAVEISEESIEYIRSLVA